MHNGAFLIVLSGVFILAVLIGLAMTRIEPVRLSYAKPAIETPKGPRDFDDVLVVPWIQKGRLLKDKMPK